MGKISEAYLKEYSKMEQVFLNNSKGLNLFDILIKIQDDKNFIFNFIKTPQIKNVIQSIKNRYKFNKDEAEDAAIFAITEYFYETSINLDTFNESVFLSNMKDEVGKRTQKMIREGYSAKEIPSTGTYENLEDIRFEEKIENGIDCQKILSYLSERDKEILELYYTDGKTQKDIADKYNISQQQMSRIINSLKDKLLLFKLV